MGSEARALASRANGRKGGGPRTERGKAVSSGNSLRHGLTARQVVVLGEKAEDFAAFHADLQAALRPMDAMEEQIAERIAFCAWRLRRAARAEAGITNAAAHEWHRRNPGKSAHAGIAFVNSVGEMLMLSRYERTLERAMHRAMLAFDRRQDRHPWDFKPGARPGPMPPEPPAELPPPPGQTLADFMRARP